MDARAERTSGLVDESWNWIKPILAFSILVGPPALFITGWCKANPSINSVSSIVPPTFLTNRISLKSTFDEVGVTSRVTAETAIGARVEEYWDTIYHQLPTQLIARCTYLGVQTSSSSSEECFPIIQIYWCRHAFEKLNSFGSSVLEWLGDGSRVNTWNQRLQSLDDFNSIPWARSFSAAPRRDPARTTTDVVPSPASISWAAESSTNYSLALLSTKGWAHHSSSRM